MSRPVDSASAAPTGLSQAEPVPVSSVPASIPSAVKVTANEREALRGLAGSYVPERFYTFKHIADNCSLSRDLIRRTVRAVARKGLATYERGLWADCGEPAGAGYALTTAGQEMVETLGLEGWDHV